MIKINAPKYAFLVLLVFSIFQSCGVETEDDRQHETDTKEEDSGDSAEEDIFSGNVSIKITGDMTSLVQGTEIIMVDGQVVSPADVTIKPNELVATTKWQGVGSIYFQVWLDAQGKSYEAEFFLEKKKLNNKTRHSTVDSQGWSYIEFNSHGDNE